MNENLYENPSFSTLEEPVYGILGSFGESNPELLYQTLMLCETLEDMRMVMLAEENRSSMFDLNSEQIASLCIYVNSFTVNNDDDVELRDELLETFSVLDNYDINMFAEINGIYLNGNEVYYLDSKTPVTASVYESILIGAKSNQGDIPITNWKRSSGEYFKPMPAVKENANLQWDWSFLGGIDLNLTSDHDVWDGSRLLKTNNTYNYFFILKLAFAV